VNEDLQDILRIVMPSALLFVILGLLLLLHHGKSWDGGSYLYDGDEFHPVVDYKQPTRTADETYTAYDQRRNHPEFLSATDSTSRIVVFYSPWCPVSTNNPYNM